MEHITDPGVIASILTLDDTGFEKNITESTGGCTKAEWVQFLQTGILALGEKQFRVYGVVDDGKIKGYMVAQNAVMPPLFRMFVIMYSTFSGFKADERLRLSRQALELVKEWAAENGCHKINITTKDRKMADLYRMGAGFKETNDITMELEF